MMIRISKAAGLTIALAACGGNTVMDLGNGSDGGESASPADAGGGAGNNGAGGGSGAAGDSSGMAGGMPIAMDAAAACAVNAGTSVGLAMTNEEYDHTVRDLLGEATSISTAENFPSDDTKIGFHRVTAPVDMQHASLFGKAASDLAATAKTHLSQLLPCNPAQAGEMACATQFISSFGKRAFRRPLTSAELMQFQLTYAQVGDFTGGIGVVISNMLSSPSFYEIEPASAPAGIGALDPYRLASRLSYFIYRSMPDDTLLASAEGGKLVSKADVEREATRMLADPKAHDGVDGFFAEWLSLDQLASVAKDPSVTTDFAALRGDIATETTKFADSIFFGTGRWQDVLTSSATWINQPLAELYGQPGVVGQSFVQVTLDPKMRAGIVTQASFLSLAALTDESSPTQRGRFIREKVLCQMIPPPPPNIISLPPLANGQSNRQRYEATMSQPSCAACHSMMDGIGYGLEQYDAIGRFRTTDNGLPVDATGQITNLMNGPVAFNGGVDLALKLASSDEVRACAVKQWFRYALSRIEQDEDACSITTATHALQMSGNLRDVVVAIASSDAFRYAHR
jgi:hypothetical protein